jgi:hypothetical protein
MDPPKQHGPPNHTGSFYVNLKRSYFVNLKYFPSTSFDMETFVLSHPGFNLFRAQEIYDMCSSYTISSTQLDAIFVLCRYVNHVVDDIEKIFCDLIENGFVGLPSCDLLANISTKKLFRNVFEHLHQPVSFDDFMCDMLEHIVKIIGISDNKINDQLFDYFDKNDDAITNLFRTIYDKLYLIINTFLPQGYQLMKLCGKQATIKEEMILSNFIDANIDLIPKSYNDDKIFKQFYVDIAEQHIDPFSYRGRSMTQGDKLRQMYNDDGWNFNDIYGGFNSETTPQKTFENMKTTIDNTVNKIGYQIANESITSYYHGFVKCLIEHNLISSEADLTRIIVSIFVKERNTIGYVDKYDTILLIDHYTIISMVNGINLSYDEFINQLIKYRVLPWNSPMETIMRVISRYFGVIINFYSEQLINLLIDNTVSEIPNNTITIYQHGMDQYYNLILLGEKFVPINEKPGQLDLDIENITTYVSETSNDLNDIVDV